MLCHLCCVCVCVCVCVCERERERTDSLSDVRACVGEIERERDWLRQRITVQSFGSVDKFTGKSFIQKKHLQDKQTRK
jgi:hypothetical protein